jgi:ABC-type spermidine/putrescine transport system permease subunit II
MSIVKFGLETGVEVVKSDLDKVNILHLLKVLHMLMPVVMTGVAFPIVFVDQRKLK